MNDGRCSEQLASIYQTLDGGSPLDERADVLTQPGSISQSSPCSTSASPGGQLSDVSKREGHQPIFVLVEARMAASTGPRSGLQALTAGGANCVPWEPSRSCPQPTTGPREGWRGVRPAGAPPHHRPSDVDPLWST